MAKKFTQKRKPAENDEFLWLVSLSDLMILLFIFFVVLFAFTRDKLKQSDLARIASALKNQKYVEPLDKVKTDLKEWVDKQQLSEQITVTQTPDGVRLEIRDKLLFDSGEYVPRVKGAEVMRLLTPVLKKLPKAMHIGIEGHTDDSPIHTFKIKDNWDLSAKRALAIMDTLELPSELLKRTVVLAHGEMKPIVPNRTPQGSPIVENQAKNRRVTIRVFELD